MNTLVEHIFDVNHKVLVDSSLSLNIPLSDLMRLMEEKTKVNFENDEYIYATVERILFKWDHFSIISFFLNARTKCYM